MITSLLHRSSLNEEKRRLELRISELEDLLDEEQNNSEILVDKNKKVNAQVSLFINLSF